MEHDKEWSDMVNRTDASELLACARELDKLKDYDWPVGTYPIKIEPGIISFRASFRRGLCYSLDMGWAWTANPGLVTKFFEDEERQHDITALNEVVVLVKKMIETEKPPIGSWG